MSDEKLFNKYLSLLQVERSTPSIDLLKRIISSHLNRIPFENVSKLLFKKRGYTEIPDLEQYLTGIEENNFGGTCYTLNYYLYLLLEHLGYKISLCGADMKNPDVHLISIVTIEENEFIVDCGYGAPFFEPLPRNLLVDYTINFGDEKYILKPKSKDETSRLEQYYKSELKHFYIAKPHAREQSEFKKVINDSYADEAMFLNSLLITRHSEEYSISLRNFMLTVVEKSKVTQKKIEVENIPEVVNTYFGIPAKLVEVAIYGLSSLLKLLVSVIIVIT